MGFYNKDLKIEFLVGFIMTLYSSYLILKEINIYKVLLFILYFF